MKIARLVIFLTGIVGMGMGGIVGISTLKNQREAAITRTNHELKLQAQGYSDQFHSVVAAVQATIKNPQMVLTLPYVTHTTGIKVENQALTEVEFLQNRQGDLSKDFILSNTILEELQKAIILESLQKNALPMGTLTIQSSDRKQMIWAAQMSEQMSAPMVVVAIIDPTIAFSSLSKSPRDAYLVSNEGKVLAHTAHHYLGTNLTKIESMNRILDSVFTGARSGKVDEYVAVNGDRLQVAFVRAGAYPFAFGVEQEIPSALLSGPWVKEQFRSGLAQKNLGLLFVVLGLGLAFFAGVSIWFSREIKRQMVRAPRSETSIDQSFPIPSSLNHAAETFSLSQQQKATERGAADAQRQNLKIERDYVKEFKNRMTGNYTLEGVERSLVQLSSELTESSTLYFRYHRRNQNLTLTAVAGDIQVPNYSLMEAYVRKDIERQVETLAEQSKVASLTNYGPISKLMMQHLNIAHFEAWAVTSDAEVSAESKIVGVLIIAQAGFRSAQGRPILAKLIRESGNYLYAYSSKMRPKAVMPNRPRPLVDYSSQSTHDTHTHSKRDV